MVGVDAPFELLAASASAAATAAVAVAAVAVVAAEVAVVDGLVLIRLVPKNGNVVLVFNG